MKFKWFRYPVDGGGDLEDLNGFLASHSAVSVTRHWVQGANGAILAFVVEYADEAPGERGGSRGADAAQGLTDAETAQFNRLRDLRKQIAEAEGVPVWTICSNQTFRLMVKAQPESITALAAIPGLGKARAEKYGQRMLDLLRDARVEAPQPGPEAAGFGGTSA